MESGDRTIPSQAIEVYKQSDETMRARTADWTKLKTTQIVQLNQTLKDAGLQPIQISEIEREQDGMRAQ